MKFGKCGTCMYECGYCIFIIMYWDEWFVPLVFRLRLRLRSSSSSCQTNLLNIFITLPPLPLSLPDNDKTFTLAL